MRVREPPEKDKGKGAKKPPSQREVAAARAAGGRSFRFPAANVKEPHRYFTTILQPSAVHPLQFAGKYAIL